MRKSAYHALLVSFLLLGGCFTVVARDRVLLVGIDHYRNKYVKDTKGCENDTKLLHEFLKTKLGFKEENVKLLINDQATEAGIRAAVQQWLIEGTEPGDRVFFAYSGHGTRVPDRSGDEVQDGMDEALAVYDVTVKQPIVSPESVVPESGYITDDDISLWISKLHGRQVVMLFDSCHSGTISRGLSNRDENESRFLRLNTEDPPQKNDVYSPDYDKNPHSRDIDVITEGFLDETVNGIVVISAARSDQEAFSINAPKYGRRQGALTYLFVEKQQNELIPVDKLESTLVAGMEELKQAVLLRRGRNGQYQIPQVQIYLRRQSALPIFGGVTNTSWTAGPEIALNNPLSKATVEIWTADGRRDYSINKVLSNGRIGEPIPIVVRTSTAGYLYVWVFSRGKQGGVAKCLFPWKHDQNNSVQAGSYSFPRCIGGKEKCQGEVTYEYFASEPEGQDLWVALVTDKPLELQSDDYEYSWMEAFQRIGVEKIQSTLSNYAVSVTSRGAGIRLPEKPMVITWQAGVIVLNTTR